MYDLAIINTRIDSINAAIEAGEPIDELRKSLNAAVKDFNKAALDEHIKSLKSVSTEKVPVMQYYLAHQYYDGITARIDQDTARYTVSPARYRVSLVAFGGEFRKSEGYLHSKNDWYRLLECFCDNAAMFRIGTSGEFVRVNKKGEHFLNDADMLDFKRKNGFDIAPDSLSKRELMRELETVFAAAMPDGMTDIDGKPLKPIKADLTEMIDGLANIKVREHSVSNVQNRLATMEKLFTHILEMRFNRTAYSWQSPDALKVRGKKSETEKAVAKENAGAPDTTTMPKAGPVKIVEPATESAPETPAKKSTRKSAKKSEPAA